MSEVKLLTPREVAEQLGLAPYTIRSYIRSGSLPAVDVRAGNRREPSYRVRDDELLAWIEARKVGAGA